MLDRDFDVFWNAVIVKKCRELQCQYGGLVFDEDCAKHEIALYYQESRDYAKNHYMVPHEDESKLNRYKVAAAFIIAILKARPLKKAAAHFYKASLDKWIFNETLALYTALTIIRGFWLADVDDEKTKLTEEQRNIIDALFREIIPISDKELHRWEIELYFLRQEGCYNLLALAHELEDYVDNAVLRKENLILKSKNAKLGKRINMLLGKGKKK